MLYVFAAVTQDLDARIPRQHSVSLLTQPDFVLRRASPQLIISVPSAIIEA